MTLCNAGNGAFTQHYAIVFNELVHGLREGLVSTKIGDHALQRQRTATIADLGAFGKCPDGFGARSV